MDFKPVQIGAPFEEFPGGSFNALGAAVQALRAQRQPSSNRVSRGDGPACLVQIRNDSSADRGPGTVLGISGPAFTYSEDETQVYAPPVLKGIVPVLPGHATKFAILKEWILDGKVGTAVIPGATWARVDVTDSAHTHAKVKNSEPDNLESGTSGYEIIYKELELESGGDELGVQWVIVLVSGGQASTTGITTVLIESPIAAATIVSAELVPELLDLRKMDRDVDGHYTPGELLRYIENHLPDAVPIPEGKCKFGYCQPSDDDPSVLVLFQASCAMLDLPEAWEEDEET